jgi:micrococcal nuclease
MKKTRTALFLLLIYPAIFLSLFTSCVNNQEAITVLKVIDGDTLRIRLKGKTEKIRLIGIDTPEMQVNDKAKRDARRSKMDMSTILRQGRASRQFVSTLVRRGDQIRIAFDVQKRDRFGRLLGYVYLSDGRMLNEEILKAGFAYILSIPPNVRYQKRFKTVFTEARENKRGLWGTFREK